MVRPIQTWEQLQRLSLQPSEKLMPLDIMGPQLKTLLISFEHHGNILPSGLRGALNWAPMMPRGTLVSEDDRRKNVAV